MGLLGHQSEEPIPVEKSLIGSSFPGER